MKIPILTYHSANVTGNEYHNNDHIAFEEDLSLIEDLGMEVVSLEKIVGWLKGEVEFNNNKKYVGLSFDDGCNLDFIDWEHPSFGFQKSFYSIMKRFPKKIHATSFVIASPKARAILEERCFAGYHICDDKWWQKAVDTGMFSIENHSWDHLHSSLDYVKQQNNLKGDFTKILTFIDANIQILQATEFIQQKVKNVKASLFAYPYGDVNKYLSKTYFPTQQNKLIAAFSCEETYVTTNSQLWNIPRFVCGEAWRSKTHLKSILRNL